MPRPQCIAKRLAAPCFLRSALRAARSGVLVLVPRVIVGRMCSAQKSIAKTRHTFAELSGWIGGRETAAVTEAG
jgi:hypothetical protein